MLLIYVLNYNTIIHKLVYCSIGLNMGICMANSRGTFVYSQYIICDCGLDSTTKYNAYSKWNSTIVHKIDI